MGSINIENVSKAFEKSWSLNSSSKWKQSNPALGQCGVTALVAQDNLGGEILKTWVVKPEITLWHYYNLIDGETIDFTISQFDQPINYDDLPSNRDEAFQDTDMQQYAHLGSAVGEHLQDA